MGLGRGHRLDRDGGVPPDVEIPHPDLAGGPARRQDGSLLVDGGDTKGDGIIFPVISKGIPINIKNTNRPDDKGTIIVDDEAVEGDIAKGITGIAGRKNFTVVYIEKVKLNSDLAFFRKLLSILESHNIYLEHMPSSIDSVSLIFRDDEESPKVDEIIQEIKAVCKPDRVGYNNNISLVSVVGRGMRRKSGSAAKIGRAHV